MAKQTVQRTVDQLRVEGLLITRPGSGTYVRGTRRRLNRLSRGRYGARRGYHADLAARYRQQLTEVGHSPAPPEVADAFGVRRRHAAGGPPPPRAHRRAAGGRGRARRGSCPADADGTSLVLRQGVRAAALPGGRGGDRAPVRDAPPTTSAARLPTRDEAELLHIRPDTPVLHLLHVAYDAEHRPIEVAQATWPGPMTTLTETYAVPGPLRPRPAPASGGLTLT